MKKRHLTYSVEVIKRGPRALFFFRIETSVRHNCMVDKPSSEKYNYIVANNNDYKYGGALWRRGFH
jgi:hypothetical protein